MKRGKYRDEVKRKRYKTGAMTRVKRGLNLQHMSCRETADDQENLTNVNLVS